MNKSALKTFATNARKELLKKVEAKALKIGITEEKIKKADIESSDAIFIDGKQLSKEENFQREKLIARINQNGFKQVMEEVAYTWFNRFTALRFMEVNDYLPTGVRVLSSSNPYSTDPDILNEALELDLEIDKEYVYGLKVDNKTEELFKYLIIKHCNELNKYLPFMFKTIDDFTELLFPEGLLAKDSLIRYMTNPNKIPEDNWKIVEIIGWLYQFYIAEEKDRVFKEKKKYKPEEIPFATQLFTPNWIVRYMVQNSLGRYWVESHPEHRELIQNWDLFLENSNLEPDFEEKIAPYINKELKVEDIKCFDPAMGSGHILVYMFDVLYEIYSKCGYMEREIPRFIIENNLYGLDIDDRAYQLACFSLVMKAMEYNNRFFRSIEREGLILNLASIQETDQLNNEDISCIAGAISGVDFVKVEKFINQFKNAKTLGSLIKVEDFDVAFLEKRIKFLQDHPANDLFEEQIRKKILGLIPMLLKQAKIMSSSYDVLVTNPPYMGTKYMNKNLFDYLKKHYPNSKADTFSSFMELSNYMKPNSLYSMITQHSWMFLSSFESLRKKIIRNNSISSMLHLGARAFEEIGGEVVQSTAFVMRNYLLNNSPGIYIRLVDFRNPTEKQIKTIEAIKNPKVEYRYIQNISKFQKVTGNPIAYWISNNVVDIYDKNKSLSTFGKPCKGIDTGNNERFLKYWYEVNYNSIGLRFTSYSDAHRSNYHYYPYNKGGSYRKWYGNNEYVIWWKDRGKDIIEYPGSNLRNKDYYRKDGLTWSTVSSSDFSIREFGYGFYFDNGGSCLFIEDKRYYMALLNSKVFSVIQKLSPTLNFQPGDIGRVPVIIDEKSKKEIINLTNVCVDLAKKDWDYSETSWDFKKPPILIYKSKTIKESFNNWYNQSEIQFNEFKTTEEKINEIFLSMYDLRNEVNPQINELDITISKGDLTKDIKSLISYAIGCFLGRYSLDKEGLVYAGGEFDTTKYQTINVDRDNIIPILPGSYFEDDIVSKFIEFIIVIFGKDTLSDNLDFIANTLGKKKGETAKETIRRYFLNDFFKDHVQTYKKKPIYWLFTSGKQKAFNCLIYMHRYDKTTLSRIRTDYLHEYQIRLDAEKNDLLTVIEGNYSAKEISNAKKELKTLDKKIEELKEYDELLHHMADMQIELDLDDGVAVNYEKFQGLVSKI